MRKLSQSFMQSLNNGLLSPFLKAVKDDDTLCLEIRNNCINIYYRGGNLVRIEEAGGKYAAYFDRKYLNPMTTRIPILPNFLTSQVEVDLWISYIPLIKHEMDLWLTANSRKEKEAQQLMVKENNRGRMATSSDYFICDMEYTSPKGRFDLIAVRWPSSASERKDNSSLGIAFIEMKYLDSALKGKAGLVQHINDVNTFLSNPNNLTNIENEMKDIFNQKLQLGLINAKKPIKGFTDRKPEMIIVLANHDPDSKILDGVLGQLPVSNLMDIKFAVSSYMGYGLYKQNLVDDLTLFNSCFWGGKGVSIRCSG